MEFLLLGVMGQGETEEEKESLLPIEDLRLRMEELFCLAGRARKLFGFDTGVRATAFALSAMRASLLARWGAL